MSVSSTMVDPSYPPTDPRASARLQATKLFSALLRQKIAPGADLLTNIEGALTAMALHAEDRDLREALAELLESWAETLRAGSEIAVTAAGRA